MYKKMTDRFDEMKEILLIYMKGKRMNERKEENTYIYLIYDQSHKRKAKRNFRFQYFSFSHSFHDLVNINIHICCIYRI